MTSIVFVELARKELRKGSRAFDLARIVELVDELPGHFRRGDLFTMRFHCGSLRANNDETLTTAIITEQGGKENHRERDQDCCSFPSQFA